MPLLTCPRLQTHARRTGRALLGTLVFALGAAGAASAQATMQADAAITAAVDSIVESAMMEGQIPGVSVSITRGGAPVLTRGYGWADLENRVPVAEQSVFRIGSVTKQFTAAAVMQLVESGQLDLYSSVDKYLPDLPAWAEAVTVEQLLNHTSGVKSYTAVPEWMELMPLELTHEELVAVFRDEPVDFAPGEGWAYNNSGYYLLGMIIEAVTGDSYADYLEREVYDPLGLDATYYCSVAPIIPNRAEGYVVEDGEYRNAPPLGMSQPYAAGSLCATASDLTKWIRALAHGELVSPASYRQMIAPTEYGDGEQRPYGYGLFVGELAGEPYVGHGGGINGFISQLTYYPEADVAIAVLSNSMNADSSALERQIARVVLGLPEPE